MPNEPRHTICVISVCVRKNAQTFVFIFLVYFARFSLLNDTANVGAAAATVMEMGIRRQSSMPSCSQLRHSNKLLLLLYDRMIVVFE